MSSEQQQQQPGVQYQIDPISGQVHVCFSGKKDETLAKESIVLELPLALLAFSEIAHACSKHLINKAATNAKLSHPAAADKCNPCGTHSAAVHRDEEMAGGGRVQEIESNVHKRPRGDQVCD